MRFAKALITVSLLALVGVAGVWFLLTVRKRPADASSRLERTPTSGAMVEQELRQLRSRMNAVEFRQVQAAVDTPRDSGPTTETTESDTAATPEIADRLAEGRAKRAREPELLDQRLAVEPRDRSWAPEYERSSTAALERAFPRDHVQEVKCATSLCRVEITHQDASAQAQFLNEYATILPACAAVRFEPRTNQDGTFSTVLHVIRRGYEAAEMLR